MTIKCLICGRDFEFLPTHLRLAHGTDSNQYREAHDIAAGEPLASETYRERHREKMTAMIADGTLTYDHLPQAVEQSRLNPSRPKRGAAKEKQREVNDRVRPWLKNKLPAGAKRADGRDADRAREYQRQYRSRHPK